MEVERPSFWQGLRCVSRTNELPCKTRPKQPQSISITSPVLRIRICIAFCKLKKVSAQAKPRGKSKEGGRSPLLGRFKGDCQGGESKLPLDYSFFRPSTALSFSYEKESGVENAFLARQKRMGRRRHPAHSNAGLKPPLRKHKAAKALLTNGAAPSRARLLLSYRSTFSKRSADVWKASVLSSSQTAAPPSRTGSCRSWSCRA